MGLIRRGRFLGGARNNKSIVLVLFFGLLPDENK